MNQYIIPQDAETFLHSLADASVDAFIIDPPYAILENNKDWSDEFSSEEYYVNWLVGLLKLARTKIKSSGSLLMFHCIGKHQAHPLFKIILEAEKAWQYRNIITIKKRRAYGKKQDYLFCREEVVWFTASDQKDFTFNIPLLAEKRGYSGFNSKYPAKSEFKRVSNVWSDLPELMRPERSCQKPLTWLDRLINTHTSPGDLVVDFFAGYGSTGISAMNLGRKFLGCEVIEADANLANERVVKASEKDNKSNG